MKNAYRYSYKSIAIYANLCQCIPNFQCPGFHMSLLIKHFTVLSKQHRSAVSLKIRFVFLVVCTNIYDDIFLEDVSRRKSGPFLFWPNHNKSSLG